VKGIPPMKDRIVHDLQPLQERFLAIFVGKDIVVDVKVMMKPCYSSRHAKNDRAFTSAFAAMSEQLPTTPSL
jgi:hypothetical protein